MSFARPRSKARTGANLFVSNIPKVLTQDDLRHIFEAYGGVIECKILIDKATGKPRGAGFVRFSFRSEAQAAVDFLADQVSRHERRGPDPPADVWRLCALSPGRHRDTDFGSSICITADACAADVPFTREIC